LKILLDENFPLALCRRLTADGEDAAHIITPGWRGASDQRIRDRLVEKDLLFLTQDEDFLFGEWTEALVVVSRVRRARRLAEHVEIWGAAIADLARNPRPQRRFELMDDGSLVAWERRSPGVWTASPPRPRDPQD
jgi:hypothetical protein